MDNKDFLTKKIFINGKIKVLSGLHIGGSNTSINIGGVDTAVIRNPFNNEPFIPGSSLKGKIRSLLEQKEGLFSKSSNKIPQGAYVDDETHPIVQLFGATKGSDLGVPSKVIFRDCSIIDKDDKGKKISDNKTTDLPFTEVKTEITVDRITATASPRQIERVPAGVEFEMQILLNVWQKEDKQKNITEKDMMKWLFNGMRMLEDDYLGGKGSRGSGQIKFYVESIKERSKNFYEKEFDYSNAFEKSEHQIPEDFKRLQTT